MSIRVRRSAWEEDVYEKFSASCSAVFAYPFSCGQVRPHVIKNIENQTFRIKNLDNMICWSSSLECARAKAHLAAAERIAVNSAALNKTGSACVVTPLGGTSDDTHQILDAFKQCGKDGSITLSEGTFNIWQVMDKLDFQNCDIHIYGTLIWSTDIQYWLSHSISVVYAGRSTAWRIGGTNVSMQGHGKALFDGNG
jgi:hypothetical protein